MQNHKKYKTDFLFSFPSFWIGVGSIINLSGNNIEYNFSDNENEADSKALYSDWALVGQDILDAKHIFDKLNHY
jgi:hypothetical protein